jgi:hypothetical protein
VRPPPDEEPAPFADFGWRLWKAAETIEDWHEDLRTLYVACTRAEDYLLLSGSLEEPFRPGNTWMQTLAGRFDLKTGECLVKELTEEPRPRVRVHDPRVDAMETRARPSPRRVLATDDQVRCAGRLAPVSLRLSGLRVFTVASVEHFRRTGAPLASPALTWQFDAEDGADRNEWAPPWISLVPGGPQLTRAESAARQVLARWDLREADSWQPLLAAHLEREPEAETMLTRFAGSTLRSQLAAAHSLAWHVEFLVGWPPGGMPGKRVGVRGLFDGLWQVSRDEWHVLALTRQEASEAGWQEAAPGLTVGAWALRQCLGIWPQSLTLYQLDSGKTYRVQGKQLQRRRPLLAFHSALRELARTVLVE